MMKPHFLRFLSIAQIAMSATTTYVNCSYAIENATKRGNEEAFARLSMAGQIREEYVSKFGLIGHRADSGLRKMLSEGFRCGLKRPVVFDLSSASPNLACTKDLSDVQACPEVALTLLIGWSNGEHNFQESYDGLSRATVKDIAVVCLDRYSSQSASGELSNETRELKSSLDVRRLPGGALPQVFRTLLIDGYECGFWQPSSDVLPNSAPGLWCTKQPNEVEGCGVADLKFEISWLPSPRSLEQATVSMKQGKVDAMHVQCRSR